MKALLLSLFISAAAANLCSAQAPPSPTNSLPVSISVFDRTRVASTQWYTATPDAATYGYVESLLRVGVAQHVHNLDWQLELAQPAMLGLPDDAVSPVAAQGQLGLGGTYYASNGNNTYPAAAFLKQGFLRYHFAGTDKTLRIGRFEFFDGQETQPENAALAWLQSNRIAQRLVGNFGFSNAQRSFDGVDAHYGAGTWDITAMSGRADQGVFNMNGNPELNVDLQYLAFTKSASHEHLLFRGFALGYHDGRTGVVKTDNRPLAARKADHKNIRIGTYGGDLIAAIPAGPGQLDFLAWGALQNGQWGLLDQRAGAAAVEGGYHFTKLATTPWLRGGWFRATGDNNAADNRHNTFFQVLPTPRVYAQFPFYNLMNNTDEFVQLMDKPAKRVTVRSELHWLRLTSDGDLWYQGGGAFDNNVFGYVGRPCNGKPGLASVADISLDWNISKPFDINFYYAHSWGKSVAQAIYTTGNTAQFGYVEFNYRWGVPQRPNIN